MIAAAIFGASACVEEAAPPQGPKRPEPLYEPVSQPPAPGMLWVAGCWHWDGRDYVWLPGHWESPPSK